MVLFYEVGGIAQLSDGLTFPSILESPHSIIVSGLLLFAIIVGSFCDSFRHKINDIEIKRQEDKKHLKLLERQNNLLKKKNRELSNQIMEETTTLQTLYEMAKKLCTLDKQVLYSAVMDILVEHLKVEICSFYILKEDSLHLVACNDRDNVSQSKPKEISIEDCHIIKKAIKEERVVSLREFTYNNEPYFKHRIMAAPVFSKADNNVIGVITIEKIPFEQFNPKTVRVFSLIAEWTSKAMANIMLFAETEEELADRERVLLEFLLHLEEAKNKDRPAYRQMASLGEMFKGKIGRYFRNSNPTRREIE
jgi:transcriptional regulator with GAF, ATPase, and Fis domain